MIFETHAHYDDHKFDEDREAVLQKVIQSGVSPIINVGASIDSTKATIELAKSHDYIYAAVGVHPSDIEDLNEERFKWLRAQTSYEKTVAVGEIGLDYYWDKEPEVQKAQRYWFGRQLELARELGLPVVVHSREAAQDTLDIVKDHASDLICDIHCFSYGVEMAREYLNRGHYLGVGGVVTFKNGRKLKEVVEYMPLDRLLLETDCPYLAPVPYRGKRNSSLYLPHVVEAIAQIKGVSAEKVIEVTCDNAKRFYQI